jgi:hypothetical protein
MDKLIYIVTTIILPVFVIISAGFGLKKALDFDISSISKVLFYLVIPSLVFTKIYSTPLDGAQILTIFLFGIAIIISMFVLSFIISRVRGHSKTMTASFQLSTMFMNSGNYGLPVVELVFSADPFATSVQVIVLITQNVFNYTLGIFLVSRSSMPLSSALKQMLSYPMLYAIVLGLLLGRLDIPIWEPIWIPLTKMASALIPLALFTLGAQIARVRLFERVGDVVLSAFCRLVASPIIAFLLISLAGIEGVFAKVLLISASMPTAVNTALIAVELKNESQFASQAVLFSTVASIITVTFTIFFSTILFC